MDLYKELDEIIYKYFINSVYEKDGKWVNFQVINEDIWNFLCEKILKENVHSISLYGGGKVGRSVYEQLHKKVNIECIIDNYIRWDRNDVISLTYEEWLEKKESKTDCVLITNIKHAEQFKAQLSLDGYKNQIIDVAEWININYPDVEVVWETKIEEIFNGYNTVNHYIRQYEKEKKYLILRRIIYSLFILKDFYSAEKYVEEVLQYNSGDYKIYKEALTEIREVLERAVRCISHTDMVINLVDGLSNYMLDKMDFLSGYAKNNIRLTGVTNNYPFTTPALKEIFTGKMPFEQEMKNIKITEENSEILKYACENEIAFHYVPGLPSCKERMNVNGNNIISSDKNDWMTLSQILFEGLALLCGTSEKKIVFLHSILEVHRPYFWVGGHRKTYNEVGTYRCFADNFEKAYYYVDKELEWYYHFYNGIGCTIVTMGDHGGESGFYYEHLSIGVKCDLPVCTLELCNPVWIIHAEKIKRRIDGLISVNRMKDILMGLIQQDIEKCFQLVEDIKSEYVELQQIPMHEKDAAENFISSKKWGMYEAAIGVYLQDEIYLKYITGKEVYFRPKEYRYRNLIKDMRYEMCVDRCRTFLNGKEVPPELYATEKYKDHMKILQKYRPDEYECIIKKMNSKQETFCGYDESEN